MLLYVYRLRLSGVRQTPRQMSHEGVQGDLVLQPYEQGWSGRRRLLAYLFDPDTRADLLPRLEAAQVVRVRQAMTIIGMEAVPRGRKNVEHYRQTWVCSPVPIDAGNWPEVRPLRGSAVAGFDPADDDHA